MPCLVCVSHCATHDRIFKESYVCLQGKGIELQDREMLFQLTNFKDVVAVLHVLFEAFPAFDSNNISKKHNDKPDSRIKLSPKLLRLALLKIASLLTASTGSRASFFQEKHLAFIFKLLDSEQAQKQVRFYYL